VTTSKWGSKSSPFMADSNIFEAAPKGDYTLFVRLDAEKTEQGKHSRGYSNGIKVVINLKLSNRHASG
jgi:hypothetical protein